MNISRSDAAGALRDIEAAQSRAGEMRGYRMAAPYLIGWGLIWAIGYTLMGLRPMSEWGLIWLPLDLVGIGGSIIAGIRDGRKARGAGMATGNPATWRVIGGMLFVAMFFAATYTLFTPHEVEPFIAFPGLVVGAIYVAIGFAWMPRLGWIGFGIFALTMIGFVFAREHLLYWMAIAGGGGLALSGFWLRTA